MLFGVDYDPFSKEKQLKGSSILTDALAELRGK